MNILEVEIRIASPWPLPQNSAAALKNLSSLVFACLKAEDDDEYISAMGDLIEAITPRIRRQLQGWRGFAEADREDLYQIICLKLVQNIRKLEDPALFCRWGSRIVRNSANTLYAKRMKEGTLLTLTDSFDSFGLIAQAWDSDFDHLENGEIARLAFADLSSRGQELIELRDGRQMTFKSIALVLGYPTDNAARVAYNREKDKLRALFEKYQ